MREAHQDAVARVSEERLWRRHVEMAKIGAIPGNGVNRAALSKEDIAVRKVLIGWARDRDFQVSVDAIGNLFVRRPGHDAAAAPVMTGSHMDSQPRGGRFDGIYGVLAGLEALQAIDEAGVKTRRPIELVAWTNEEGGRFPPCTMGSAVYTGARQLGDFLDATDNEGTALRCRRRTSPRASSSFRGRAPATSKWASTASAISSCGGPVSMPMRRPS